MAMANTLAYYDVATILAVKNFIVLVPYSQHFIFFVAYELTRKARVFVTSNPSKPIVL
jgi:hypothetical protein